ncbi:MAG: transcriptional activator RfaH [Bryobacterales bacterium]|nr:transcriptional activator RfaH [Bryobacterales bacterium]
MRDLPIQPKWYALYVRSHHEKNVFAQLEAKQYNAFLPLYLARQKWADRWKTLPLPLFPSYVFCCFDATKRSPVLATPGVIGVVRFGSGPAPVDNNEIEAIRLITKSALLTEPYLGLVRGQRVKIVDGPLSGIAGTLTEIRKRPRLVVSVELLQRSVLVEIEREWAVPYEPGSQLVLPAHCT